MEPQEWIRKSSLFQLAVVFIFRFHSKFQVPCSFYTILYRKSISHKHSPPKVVVLCAVELANSQLHQKPKKGLTSQWLGLQHHWGWKISLEQYFREFPRSSKMLWLSLIFSFHFHETWWQSFTVKQLSNGQMRILSLGILGSTVVFFSRANFWKWRLTFDPWMSSGG